MWDKWMGWGDKKRSSPFLYALSRILARVGNGSIWDTSGARYGMLGTVGGVGQDRLDGPAGGLCGESVCGDVGG